VVRLAALPAQAIIDDFKGKVDFYVYKGQPCARRWPTWPRRVATGQEAANQQAFAYAIKSWNELSEYIRQMYYFMAAGTGLSPRDFFVRSYLKGNPFYNA